MSSDFRYDPDNPKMLCVWFNPYDPDHMAAYKKMQKVGVWPRAFLDLMAAEDVIIHDYWQGLLREKLADCWVEFMLKDYVSKRERDAIIRIFDKATPVEDDGGDDPEPLI